MKLGEFKMWLDALKKNPEAELEVHQHKTADVYGAARVNMTSMKNMFLSYGRERMQKYPQENDVFFYGMPSFSVSWGKVRRSGINMKCSDYRKFVETRVSNYYGYVTKILLSLYFPILQAKETLSPIEQEALARRLLHRPQVAVQSYQATTASYSQAGSNLLSSIVKPFSITAVDDVSSVDNCESNGFTVSSGSKSPVSGPRKRASASKDKKIDSGKRRSTDASLKLVDQDSVYQPQQKTSSGRVCKMPCSRFL